MGAARHILSFGVGLTCFVAASAALYAAGRPNDRAMLARIVQAPRAALAPLCNPDGDSATAPDLPPFFTAVPACR
jgi:hypothetical protein